MERIFCPGRAKNPLTRNVGSKMMKRKNILTIIGFTLLGMIPLRPDKVSYTSVEQIIHPSHTSRLSIPKEQWFFMRSPEYILLSSPTGEERLYLETDRQRKSLLTLIMGKWKTIDWNMARISEFQKQHPELNRYWEQ